MCLPILLLRFKDAMAQQAPWDSTGDILPMASPCLNQPILLQIQGGIILTEASSSNCKQLWAWPWCISGSSDSQQQISTCWLKGWKQEQRKGNTSTPSQRPRGPNWTSRGTKAPAHLNTSSLSWWQSRDLAESTHSWLPQLGKMDCWIEHSGRKELSGHSQWWSDCFKKIFSTALENSFQWDQPLECAVSLSEGTWFWVHGRQGWTTQCGSRKVRG